MVLNIFILPVLTLGQQITVAKDNSGDYTTVQAAFDAIPNNNTEDITLFVKNEVYDEKIVLSSSKNNVTLNGENRDSTILTYNDYSGKVVNGITVGTSTSYSVAIDASDFIAKNITFRNTSQAAQAVALRVTGDRGTFVNCNILGYQDTYYTCGHGRIYNYNCLTEGTTDFIFGRSITVFENCDINSKKNSTITAANTDVNYQFGYTFINCKLTADAGVNRVELGRPWGDYARTVYINCEEGSHIDPLGWSDWDGRSKTCFYAEYKCSGTGYKPDQRVTWSYQLTDEEAKVYTLENIFSKNSVSPAYKDNWLPPTEYLTEVNEQYFHLSDFTLKQNYPNPFNPATIINFSIPKASNVLLEVFDVLGRKVATLFDENKKAGNYCVEFNASNLSSGIYFYRFKTSGKIITKKMLLLK